MDSTMPSIGDVLMFSQVAWRTGRAFTSGRSATPKEFHHIEAELHGVAKALKLLAETLLSDGVEQFIQQADRHARTGLANILHSCKRTLDDLESLIDQYQVIKKNKTSGGYTVERSWSELVIQNYTAMMWTTEGGNIHDLRDLLRLHAASISLAKQALQSNDLGRLNRTIIPISEKVEEIYSPFVGSMHDKLMDLRAVIDKAAGRSPALSPNIPTVGSIDSSLSQLSIGQMSGNISPVEGRLHRPAPLITPTQTPEMIAKELPRSPIQISPTTRQSPSALRGLGLDASDDRTTAGPTPSLTPPPQQHRQSPRRILSGRNLPSLETRVDEAESLRLPYRRSASESDFSSLPPSAWGGREDRFRLAKLNRRARTDDISPTSTVDAPAVSFDRSKSTPNQQDVFEKMLFKNSAILCDLRGTLVEFTQPGNDDDRPWDLDIEKATEGCRICLVRRRDILASGRMRFTTNVWSFSDDLTVRLQHTIPDDIELIPYSSYFDPCKVSITIPANLVFHGIHYDDPPLRLARSEWINYVFETETDAKSFQNQLFGRTLIASFKTEKTSRVHEGMGKMIAFQEQMCAMETLRLWEEEGSGAVLGMIHFSAQFRRGYMMFYLNSQDKPVRVRDEGGKIVKIKGLRIPLDIHERGKVERRPSDTKRLISGAKVEFASESEKLGFLETVERIQKRMVEGLQELNYAL